MGHVQVERSQGIVTVTLSNPAKRNAIPVGACPEIEAAFRRRGLSIDGGGSWSLPRTVGLLRAKELALLGDIVTAAEAERMGLVSRVVPRSDLDATSPSWRRGWRPDRRWRRA